MFKQLTTNREKSVSPGRGKNLVQGEKGTISCSLPGETRPLHGPGPPPLRPPLFLCPVTAPPPLPALFFLNFLIGVELIYNVVLVSGVQQNDSVIHMYTYLFFFRFFSIIGYYKILNVVPCALQSVLVVYLFYT